ncbi:MAG: hypothetical protein FJZ00_00660 [Candidatus Sericytochromatia bacterium]|uniref:Uncharacterized protein n=1 Tax=Candidatus Tanganyikabacteria bacterium TaxID=2961651 RepID=A0A938BHQ6_9BACT|nr:hypothetical protein [Candidatus Tanganyikabacteria bacterium]
MPIAFEIDRSSNWPIAFEIDRSRFNRIFKIEAEGFSGGRFRVLPVRIARAAATADPG